MIVASGLAKRYAGVKVVDDLSLTARSGATTVLLGPNGAGKTTTLHLMLGLVRGVGRTTFMGQELARTRVTAHVVGAVLDGGARAHPRRSARDHLRMVAAPSRLSSARVEWCLERCGLSSVRDNAVGSFSLGMRQRLGLATALLGEPHCLVLDEPTNGLDPQGVRWLREVLRQHAREGGTTLLSSHQIAEASTIADDVVVIGRGSIIASGPVDTLVGQAVGNVLEVESPDIAALAEHVARLGGTADMAGTTATLHGVTREQVGDAAAAQGWRLYRLEPRRGSLEDAFLSISEQHRSIRS